MNSMACVAVIYSFGRGRCDGKFATMKPVYIYIIPNYNGGALWQHNTHPSASSFASSCVPQPSKQLLNACPIPPVHVIVTLLAGCQSAILSSN